MGEDIKKQLTTVAKEIFSQDQSDEIRQIILSTLLNYDDIMRIKSGNIQSGNFKSGSLGWQILSTGHAEFQNVNIGFTQISIDSTQNINAAIESVNSVGGGVVFLKSGSYVLNENIYLYSNIKLVGQSAGNTFIDFGGQAYGIIGIGTNIYTTGTISAVSNNATLTGSGTTWTSAMVGRTVLINENAYIIIAVHSPTELVIDAGFSGTTASGYTYWIANPIDSAYIDDLTITNSSGNGIELQYSTNIYMNKVYINSCNIGLYCANSLFLTINDGSSSYCTIGTSFLNVVGYTLISYYVFSNTGDGIVLNGGGNSTIFNWSSTNNGGRGIVLTSTKKLMLNSFTVESNVGHNFEFVSGNYQCQINSGVSSSSSGDGFKFTATTDQFILSGCNINGNTGYGINIAASTDDNNIILGNILLTNTAGQLTNSGTGTKIKSNIGVADGA